MIFLQTHPIFSIILLTLISLCLGSFFNVVISRYPEMLMRGWRADCREFLELPSEPTSTTFNLALPPSHCPLCKKLLAIWYNIPLISYLLLTGRCKFCHQRISIQYPLVELITVLTTLAVFFQWGWQVKTFALWLITWGLIVLAGIDWKTQILPDTITISLMWIGLILNIHYLFTSLPEAVLAAIIGYCFLAVAASLFKLIRKKKGMGNGDFKMLSMFGAWVGILPMFQILLIAVLLSVVVTLVLLFLKKVQRDQPLPFGPWLAVSGWLVLMFEPLLNNWSIQWLSV